MANKYIKNWLKLLLVVATFAIPSLSRAQCTFSYTGQLCIGTVITFPAPTGTSNWNWDFNGEGTSTSKDGSFSFAGSGSKTIKLTCTDALGKSCSYQITITINDKPIPKITLLSPYDQCFEKNLYCFKDETTHPQGVGYSSIIWILDATKNYTSLPPQTRCLSVADPRGGKFDLDATYVDINGCVGNLFIKDAINVYPKIGPSFDARKPKVAPFIGCDSVLMSLQNNSRIDSSLVKKVGWYYRVMNAPPKPPGPWIFLSDCWRGVDKMFTKQGNYEIKLELETFEGCKDSMVKSGVVQVTDVNTRIVADKDSVCWHDDPTIAFTVTNIPNNYISANWLFGDPPSGNANVAKGFSATHKFVKGLGPFEVSLTYSAKCGNQTITKKIFDTILVIGPWSKIEKANFRIKEWQVYQCPKPKMDTVVFDQNWSEFYHNDSNMWNDDETYTAMDTLHIDVVDKSKIIGHDTLKDCQGRVTSVIDRYFTKDSAVPYFTGMGHKFKGNQDATADDWSDAKKRRQRQFYDQCMVRIWDFGDDYAVKCTTNTKKNWNVNTNCKYSVDSLGWHYYRSWDDIMLTDFKNNSQDDAIFIDSNRLCKRLNVWPDSVYWVITYPVLSVPKNAADIAKAKTAPYNTYSRRNFLKEDTVKGPGEREVEDYIEITIPAGSTIKISSEVGNSFGPIIATHTGPKTLQLKRKDVIIIPDSNSKFWYNFYTKTVQDTIPRSFYKLLTARGDTPSIIKTFKKTRPGKLNFDYSVSYNRFRDLWYSRTPQCNNVKLDHADTCHPLKCKGTAIKQLSLMHVNAGGVGSGLLKQSKECLGSVDPQYGVTFVLSDLKPGCTFSDIQINPDINCDPDGYVKMMSLQPGNRPPGLPLSMTWINYLIGGNVPNRFSMNYTAAGVCAKDKCVDVGIIIGNGVSKTGTKPLCADTQIYDNFACFPLLDPEFEILRPKPNADGNRKICKWDSVIVRTIKDNKTDIDDLKELSWTFGTNNASPYYSLYAWDRIQEEIFQFKKLNTVNGVKYDPKKVYHYLVQTRSHMDPKQVFRSNTWVNPPNPYYDSITRGGNRVIKKDTVVIREVFDWDTFADVSLVWDAIKAKLEAKGFDPFSISGSQMAKMLWNNVGTIGQPLSGARGCIDTNGFGKYIKFKVIVKPDSIYTVGSKTFVKHYYKSLHYRDTSIRPMDSTMWPNNKVRDTNVYIFRPRWSGFYTMDLTLQSNTNDQCIEFKSLPIIVGFGMDVKFNDSIVCRNEGKTLYAVTDYKYFNTDPINNGTWDFTPYWRDPQRQIDIINGVPNREGVTHWDWSKADDDLSNPQTIFGGTPYGGTGVGSISPGVQLGGGAGKYYNDDSGVYVWRNIATDSTGCSDTITKRIFISRLDVKFGLTPMNTDCKPVLQFLDSAVLHDPCKWALPYMNNGEGCDFITSWFIDWGDNTRGNYYEKNTRTDPDKPKLLSHNYRKYGWYNVKYYITTNQGCKDSFSRWVYFPGPKAKFEFTTKAGNIARICVDDVLDFTNLSARDSMSKAARYLWNFGDGKFSSDSNKFIFHQYTKAGTYYVYQEVTDSVVMPPSIRVVCTVKYPDTAAGDPLMIVIVSPRDSVKGKILHPVICSGDFNQFIDMSSPEFKSYKWTIWEPGATDSQVYSWSTDTLIKQFFKKGKYKVRLSPEYDPSKPKPWCPFPDVDMSFEVDSIAADFNIDPTTPKPDFSFDRITLNGVEYRWGFLHKEDITNPGSQDRVFVENLKTMDKNVHWRYDDTGRFWVCLIAKSANGCLDTMCKIVSNDFLSLIRISNVFTPGTDGFNDVWQVYIKGQNFFHVRITNRYGAKVFETNDGTTHWNGKVDNKGAECPEGTYFYEIQYRMKDWKEQKIKTVKGGVYLIR